MSWPDSRPETYDEDLIWDEDGDEWVSADGSGGSRFQTNLIAVGYDDDGYGVIYYG
jgi:hypothetical protein